MPGWLRRWSGCRWHDCTPETTRPWSVQRMTLINSVHRNSVHRNSVHHNSVHRHSVHRHSAHQQHFQCILLWPGHTSKHCRKRSLPDAPPQGTVVVQCHQTSLQLLKLCHTFIPNTSQNSVVGFCPGEQWRVQHPLPANALPRPNAVQAAGQRAGLAWRYTAIRCMELMHADTAR